MFLPTSILTAPTQQSVIPGDTMLSSGLHEQRITVQTHTCIHVIEKGKYFKKSSEELITVYELHMISVQAQ